MNFTGVTAVGLLFLLLFLIMAGLLLARWYRAQKRAESEFVAKLRNYKGKSKNIWRAGLLGATAVLLSLAVLGPQWGEKVVRSEANGVDVMFLLDVSKSMQAQDMSVSNMQLDRLSAAKAMIADFVSVYPENRYGLVVFAGDAFVTTPLTFDKQAFVTFLEGVSYKDVSEQGTDLALALGQTLGRFGMENEDRGQVVVLVSDGGDEVSSNYQAMVEDAKEQGVKIVTVGIGSEEGVPIPEGKDMLGKTVYKTYQGETVMTKLNDKPLKDIADTTGGTYVQAKLLGDMKKVEGAFADLETSTLMKHEGTKAENRFQWLVLPALMAFLVAIILPLVESGKGKGLS